jgi:hypothetical protein
MKFEKATLQEISSTPSANPQPTKTPAIVVQINPASLRLQMQNTVDAGKAFARPATQYQGTSSSTLSFDLVFDTADEGETNDPVDVRGRTAQLERFLLPSKDNPKAVPPRVRFTYGTLTVVGVMTSLNTDFDFFSVNGVPLRAKCAVSIKEQKPEFDANLVGPGANTGSGATPPLPPGGGAGAPGAPAAPPADRTGTALAGESAADFAARMGLDPRAWKDLAAGLSDPLSLAAGLQVDFSASLSLDVGVGVEVGVTAGGAPGADAPPPSSPVPDRPPADGPALTAAGGLTRALDRETAARAARAAAAGRAAFPVPPRPAAPAAAGPGPGTPVLTRPGPARPPAPAGPGRAAAVTADPRAASFGFGVPLRERRGVTTRATVGLVHERSRVVVPAAVDGVPESDDPAVPRWAALRPPPADGPAGPGGPAARRGCGCGCGGGR